MGSRKTADRVHTGGCPANGRLLYEIERVWYLQIPLRAPAIQVAPLVADIGDDLVALLFDLAAGRRVERNNAVELGLQLSFERMMSFASSTTPLPADLRLALVASRIWPASHRPVMKNTVTPLSLATL